MPNSAGLARAEWTLRRTIRTDLEAWCRYALRDRGLAPAAHHLAVIGALRDLATARTRRLILLLPPGSAKSTYASVLFPAWWMARHPASAVVMASHTASLADHFGRGVRGLLSAHGVRLNVFLRRDARAAGCFETESGGEYFAVGVHGAVTGRRADLALIDDPVASFADAETPASRERLWNWYRSELETRVKPGGRIALIMTRWHKDDLAGRLIEAGGWTVLRLPALAEADDPLGRGAGEPLWPEWEDRAALLEKQEVLGERSFAAMFQQTPMASGGGLFDVSRLGFIDTAGDGEAVRGWDLASGTDASRDPDWTVGVRLSRESSGGFVVDDVQRVRVSPVELEQFILNVARQDGEAVTISLPQDPGQAGAHQVMTLSHALAGFYVQPGRETNAKTFRAQKVAGQVAAGNLRLRRANWNRGFIEELAAFPNGRKDDQVDALSRAYGILVPDGIKARFATVPLIGR